VIDERFLVHRLRSTSLAGTVGGVLAALLWAYQYYALDTVRWDLAAVVITMAAVKVAAMVWFRTTD
jgi:hypothetical protein